MFVALELQSNIQKWLVYTVKILSLAGTFRVSCYSDVFELLYTTVSKTVCALHFLTTLCCERHKESTEIRMKRDHTGTDFFSGVLLLTRIPFKPMSTLLTIENGRTTHPDVSAASAKAPPPPPPKKKKKTKQQQQQQQQKQQKQTKKQQPNKTTKKHQPTNQPTKQTKTKTKQNCRG